MYLKTQFPEFVSDFKMSPDHIIYTCGSCFAEELSKKLNIAKFNNLAHPFGIVFNPLSISRQFKFIFDKYTFCIEDLVYHNGLYHSPDHHGVYSNPDPDIALQEINERLIQAHQLLPEISTLILTLGSAHHFISVETKQTVANCHKLPAWNFIKRRASLHEIIQVLDDLFAKLLERNPRLKIILSVSPVRYLKDGFGENNLSKASLLLAANALCEKYKPVIYFPAYEIFMDDLRDYRYVTEDLVHPNKAAVDYIWSYFETAFFDEPSQNRMKNFSHFYKLLDHRILHPLSEDHKAFIKNLMEETERLQVLYPDIDLEKEKDKIKQLRS